MDRNTTDILDITIDHGPRAHGPRAGQSFCQSFYGVARVRVTVDRSGDPMNRHGTPNGPTRAEFVEAVGEFGISPESEITSVEFDGRTAPAWLVDIAESAAIEQADSGDCDPAEAYSEAA